jgi:DNA-binding GntR family transcriptional regulator
MTLDRRNINKAEPLIQLKQVWKAIAEDIKEDIISGHYKPLERVKEGDLAAKYSVSKTPIREAIRYLEGIGYIEMIPHTMIRVRKMNKKDVQNIYRILSVLEGLAAREALWKLTNRDFEVMEKYATIMEGYSQDNNYYQYSKANNSFHAVIWQASDNQQLIDQLQNTFEKIQRFHSVPRRFPDRFKDLAPDHRKILKAISRKDEEKTEMLARRHVQKHEEYIVELLDKENSFSF